MIANISNATDAQAADRLSAIGDRSTAGPTPPIPRWSDGWWDGARRVPAHPGRLGGVIKPWASVVHTTDMLPEEWDALLRAWTERVGDGACATFLIGRDAAHGTVQLAPTTRNANHAGGPTHGVFDTQLARGLHPNLTAIGIELHCAGGVHLIGGQWRLVEGGAAHGAPLPADEVEVDRTRPGRGWHTITDYQRAQLLALLGELEQVLAPMPAGAATRTAGEKPDAFTAMPTGRVVTHAQLDPAARADPWRPTCEWLAQQLRGRAAVQQGAR